MFLRGYIINQVNLTKGVIFMPIYFIFIIIAIVIAIFSEKIDEKINANGKLRRAVTICCILFVILTSILIKKAL